MQFFGRVIFDNSFFARFDICALNIKFAERPDIFNFLHLFELINLLLICRLRLLWWRLFSIHLASLDLNILRALSIMSVVRWPHRLSVNAKSTGNSRFTADAPRGHFAYILLPLNIIMSGSNRFFRLIKKNIFFG
jgi:hypothetical protein